MRDLAKNIRLPSIDDLFSTEEERQDAKLEKIQILPLSELHPFEGHPFQVCNDEEMDKMVDSVKEYGVMTPAIVRPRRDGGYEIVATPPLPRQPARRSGHYALHCAGHGR